MRANLQNQSSAPPGERFVFPGWSNIEIDSTCTFGVEHLFPEITSRVLANDKTSVPMFDLSIEVGGLDKSYVSNMEEHTFLKPNIYPPTTAVSNFCHENIGLRISATVSDLLLKDDFDIVFGDVADDYGAVDYYDKVINDVSTYTPVVPPFNEDNKALNAAVVNNMMGEPVSYVLDIGTGKGQTLTRLERLGRIGPNSVIHCVEPNAELCSIIRKTVLHSGAKFFVFQMPISRFLAATKFSYDLVVANFSLHFAYHDDPDVISKVRAVMRENGEFLGVYPSYDSLVFRPFGGNSVAGLEGLHYDTGWKMYTEVSSIRRLEPILPYWVFKDSGFAFEFTSGSHFQYESPSQKEVMGCFVFFKGRVSDFESDFYSVVSVRDADGRPFSRCGFHPKKKGRVVHLSPFDPGTKVPFYYNKGNALSWSDFFSLRSWTGLVCDKTDGEMGNLYAQSDHFLVVTALGSFRLNYNSDGWEGYAAQVEVVWRSASTAELWLVEDHRQSLFFSMFNNPHPSFLFKKTYIPTIDYQRVLDLLINSKEGIVISGPCSGTAYSKTVSNSVFLKWDPTVDLLRPGGVKEFHLSGEFVRNRPDKLDANDWDKCSSLFSTLTPFSFYVVLAIPMIVPAKDQCYEVLSYPFSVGANYTRNAMVYSYMHGMYGHHPVRVPSSIVQYVSHSWNKELLEEVLSKLSITD